MFRRKRAKEAPAQAPAPSAMQSSSRPGPGGYVITELPTYHGLKRKIVVYTSDANGKIIKSFKKG